MKSLIPNNPQWLQIAQEWHGGQESTLYAVASTGDLTRGVQRPYGCSTDAEWEYELWSSLEQELRLSVLMSMEENTHEYKEVEKFLLHVQAMEAYWRKQVERADILV